MTLEERNETYRPPSFDGHGGKLGVTPILWEIRLAYEWSDHFAEINTSWDQCCTYWVVAVSEREAREKAWRGFEPPAVMPQEIATCFPLRFYKEPQ